MKKSLLLSSLFTLCGFCIPFIASAAIAYTGGACAVSGGGDMTINLTASSTNELMVAYFMYVPASTPTVTVGGVSATKVGSTVDFQNGDKGDAWIYYNPPTSATNYVASANGTNADRFCVALYSGAAQSGQVDSFTSGTTASAASLTMSNIVVAVNSWLVSFISAQNVPTASTGLHARISGVSSLGLADSNADLSAGSHSGVWTFSTGSATGIQVSIAPVAGGGGGGGSSNYPTGQEVFGTTTTFAIVDSPVLDLWLGMVLFMSGFWGTVWFFRKSRS